MSGESFAMSSIDKCGSKSGCCSGPSSGHKHIPAIVIPSSLSSPSSTPTSADFPPLLSPTPSAPLLPSGPIPQPKSVFRKWFDAMSDATRRLAHSHGDKHSHGCGHDHGYDLVDEHEHKYHGHSHDHGHGHSHGEHGHTHGEHHDDEDVLSLDPSDAILSVPGRHRVTFFVEGMDCPSCSPRVVRALTSLPSVAECHVDVFAGRATVTYHPEYVQIDEMSRRVTVETGFKCSLVEDAPVGNEAPTRRMRVQLGRPGVKYPDMDGIRVVSDKSGEVELEFDAALNPRDVLALFDPWDPTYLAPARESSTDSAQREVLRLLQLTLISAVLCLPVLVLAWAPLPPNPTVYGGTSLALTTLIQLYVARPIYVSGLRALTVQRTIDMDLLVALSTGTAYIFSTVAYACRVAGVPIEHQGETYFETSALLVTLVMLGRLIAAYARRRSTNAVSELSSIQPDDACLVQNGDARIIPAGLVHVGDVLRVRAGERVPTDGRVVSGEAYVDESSVTGESVPVLKRPGAVVVAGTVLARGATPLDMRVTLSPDSNTLSRMAELMRAAQGARLKVQDTADYVASYLAPVVLVIGTITLICWTAVGVSAANKVADATARAMETREAVVDAIGFAVAVLVVSCPCAIALCVPMVAVIAVAVGTRRGVLFKTVEALESTTAVQVVVFDKTGTLTLGKLAIESSTYYPQESASWMGSERGIQSVVRALTESTHPVSVAVHEHVIAVLGSTHSTGALDVRIVPGHGVEATFDGVVVRGGSATWAGVGARSESTVYVVSVSSDPDNAHWTRIAQYTLSDTLRPDALATVQALTARGLEVHVLSGDTQPVVARTASALGIPTSQARGGCLPEDKAQWIKFLQLGAEADCEKGSGGTRKVMFVGDGTNDALALVQSDVGVSLGGGTDVASSAAQIVLLSSLCTGLSDVFNLARAARRRVWINFIWAGIYNTLAILLASGVLGRVRIPPQLAGLGELVSVLPVVVVAWSLGVVSW